MTSVLYDEYDKLLNEVIDRTQRMPHCDQWVLHSPGTCEYCDQYDELQDFREANMMQFTNEEFDPDVHLFECPALKRRPLTNLERWGGNIAHVDLRPPTCICYPGMCPQECEPACPAC